MAEIARIGIKAADSVSAGILGEGQRMMARLPSALPGVLEKIEEVLFERSERATGGEEQRNYLSLQGELRSQRDVVTGGFSRALQTEFAKAVSLEPEAAAKKPSKLELSELSLVDFDDMDESLSVTGLATGLRNACSGELRGLDVRVARLLGVRDLPSKNNPFGPDVVANAFKQAFSSIQGVKSRTTLLQLVEKYFQDTLAGFYHDLNAYFISRGVEPEIKPVARKATPSASPSGPRPGNGDGKQAGPQQADGAGADPGDMFSSLQQLIMMNAARAVQPGMAMPAGGVAPGAGVPGGGALPPIVAPQATGELLQSLTHLQRGNMGALPVIPEGFTEKLDTEQLTSGTGNVLRDIRDSGLYNPANQVDAITIDVVALLFDFVFDDKDIPAAVRVLIGRLQIPVLKAAMLDKKFFSKRDNPARKLLDRLAQVSVAWSGDVSESDPLYQRLSTIVHGVIDNFEDDASVFDRAVDQLDQYIAEEESHAEEHSKTTAEALYQREISEFAQILAQEEIVRRAHNVPEEIQQFLLKYWKGELVAAYESGGESGEAWVSGLQAVDDLAWSIEPKVRQEDRLRLVRTLPPLLKRIEGAMRSRSASDEEVKDFSAKLVQLHITALKGAPPAPPQPAPVAEAPVAAEVKAPAAPVPEVEVLAPEPEVIDDLKSVKIDTKGPSPILVEVPLIASEEEVPLLAEGTPAEQAKTTPAAIQAAPPPVKAEPASDATLKWTLPTKDLTAEDEYDHMARQLKKGCWVEFSLDDGSRLRSKLTWVSPMKGVMLFTERDGSNAVKISPKSLAKRFRIGTATVLGDASLIERAVTNVMGQLMKNGPEGTPQPA